MKNRFSDMLVKFRAVFLLFVFILLSAPTAHAATSPSLGVADTFGVLAHSFIPNHADSFNTTSIATDLGYAILSGIGKYVVSGTTYIAPDATYIQAGADQNTALTALNSQSPCTATLPFNADLSAYNSGNYTPGIYCASGVVTIGNTVNLNGAGTFIFRISGTLTTASFSHVNLNGGASACDVFWTLTPGVIVSSLGIDSVFVGTLIDTDTAGLTINDAVTWVGRALIYGGSASTGYNDHITVPTLCSVPPPPPTKATLHVIKHVVNSSGGKQIASDFTLHVKGSGMMGLTDVTNSPTAGAESPGTIYSLDAGSYVVSEDADAGYTSVMSGDCDATGHVTLTGADNKTCTITNTDIAPSPHVFPSTPATLHIIKHVVNNNGGKAVAGDFLLHVKGGGSFGLVDVTGSPVTGYESPGTAYTLDAGTYAVSEDVSAGYAFTFSGDCNADGNVTLVAGDNKTCVMTNDDIGSQIPTPGSATLHVIKVVVNDNGGKAIVSDAIIHVMSGAGDVSGSPHAGASAPGTSYTLDAGTYTVSEAFFPGYSVKIGGDCNDSGTITLATGENKTCTITNNDIAVIVPPPTIITTSPPVVVPLTCDICSRLTYDVYIINPDKTERHTGTAWVRVTDRGNGVKRYSFEDATLDPHNSLFDYNDSVIDVDFKDCKNTKFMFVSSDASWKHQVRIKVSIDGVTQSDTLVTDDSKAVVGTIKSINATTQVNTKLACMVVKSTTPTGMKGKILLQVQSHGEAWYIHPVSGLRYYMKDGNAAYGMMRSFGLGITDKNLLLIPSVSSVDELKASSSICASNSAAKSSAGKILLQVQSHGEAWYVDVAKCRRIYLKDGAAAYAVMRFLGLGITNVDLAKVGIGS